MEILCIKTTDQTSNLVVQHGLYYSHGIPQKEFSAVLILGTAKNGKIPVLAECDVITIDKCETVDSRFSKIKKEWKYEWKLQINNTFKRINDISIYVNNSSKSYSNIKHCQGISYVNRNDISSNLPMQGKVKYILTQAASQLSNTKNNQNLITTSTHKPTVNIVPLKKVYVVGEIINIKVRRGFKNEEYKGKILTIKEKNKIDSNGKQILVDQILEVELPNLEIKKYVASNIASLSLI